MGSGKQNETATAFGSTQRSSPGQGTNTALLQSFKAFLSRGGGVVLQGEVSAVSAGCC